MLVLLCCFLREEEDSLEDPYKIAERGYGLYEMISVQNPSRFLEALIDVDTRSLLNKIFEPGQGPSMICTCAFMLFFAREGEYSGAGYNFRITVWQSGF